MDARQVQTLRILHLAMMASVVFYGVIVFLAVRPFEAGETEPSRVILYVLAGLGGTTALVVMPTLRRVLVPPEEQRPHKLFTGSIVVWAVCESIAVEGLVAAFLYHEPWMYPPFGAVALIAMLYAAPRRPD